MENNDKFLQARRKQLETIKMISKDQETLTRDELEKKYNDFATNNPKTWINIMDKNFSIGHLERKIELYENFYTRSNEKDHQSKKFYADVAFAEDLAEKHLYPHIGNPSQEQKNKALGLAKKKAGIQ